jgi:hypothetical protein
VSGVKEVTGMAKTVLLVGVRADLLEAVRWEPDAPDIGFLIGTG